MNKLVIIIIAAVVLLGGGGAAAFFLLKPAPEVAEGDAAEVVEKQADPIFVELKGLTVNFQDRGKLRYLATTIELMHRDQDVIDQLEVNMPIIRNNILMILSDNNFEDLRTTASKEELRGKISTAVGEVVGGDKGLDVPVETYLTSWVMQ